MLQLLLGGSGSGKTTLLYQRIRARAEKGEKSILLVPEQFTSSTEGRIYRELGDALSGMVESFSFTSLAEKILSTEGGAAVQTLSDAGRAVLVRRALEELQDNVHYYHRHRRSAAFCQMAAQTIDELKSAGLSGQQLAQLAGACGAESGKLSELALIFQGYETLLARSGMDPSDRLELAGARLEEALARHSLPEFLRDRAVFIDEFDTFNAPKKRLLGAMLAALPSVTVALCDDGAPLLPGDLSLRPCWPAAAWTPLTGWSWPGPGWRKRWPGTACRSFCGTGRCSLMSSIPSMPPKSGCWGPCWRRCPA